MTPYKATHYLEKKSLLPGICAARFPVKDSTIIRTGPVIIKHHVDTVPGPSVECPPQLPGQPPTMVHCPPSTARTDTFIRIDTLTIIRENTAKTAALTNSLAVTKEQLRSAENGRGNWRGRALWTWIAIVVIGGGYLFLKSRLSFLTDIINKLK
jgi:hypothetical protein